MDHRTKNKLFSTCPICGKKPYVRYYPPNYGFAVCSGTVFHPHDLIKTYVGWENPSKLIEELANKWNQAQFLDFSKFYNTKNADNMEE